ncbi:MAG: Gfo/Idh/MocA family oxidoreductase [Dehalococcoidia bacterium]|nr:Gfo/Idh/MocA family oxidoreductase [Dehalococcoidia bacterium]
MGVVSRDLAKAQKFAAYHSVPHVYDNLAALLNNKDVHALYVATPNSLHATSVVAAAQRGIHVMSAVAMTATEEDCITMVEACKKHNVRLGVDFQTRWHPAFRALKQTMVDGTLGEIITAHVQLSSAGSALRPFQGWRVLNDGMGRVNIVPRTDAATTYTRPPDAWQRNLAMRGAGVLSEGGMFGTDMLRFLLGDVTEVTAIANVATAPRNQETYVVASVVFKSGVVVSYDSADSTPYPDNAATVYGTKGTAIATGLQTLNSDGTLEIRNASGRQNREFFGHNMYQDEFEAFNACIAIGKDPDPSGVDGWRERQLVLAMRESAVKGVTVKLKM